MAQTFDSQRLRNERAFDEQLSQAHRALAERAGQLVLRAAQTRGEASAQTVPNLRTVRERLKRAIWSEVVKPFYIGAGVDPLLGGVPQSEYTRLVVAGIESAVRISVERQVALVRRHADPLVAGWLLAERQPPRVAEFYDPYHTFVDPSGYRLSDRVWRSAISVRSRIDLLLDYHIARGTSAVRIAQLLEEFLTPSASTSRTATPYGREGSYAARRLARTEITAAAGRATVDASRVNPYVQGVRWTLSRSHRCCDICDVYATGGVNGDGVYTPDTLPSYPAHPHDMCNLQPVIVPNSAEITERLAADIQRSRGRLLGAFDGGRAAALLGILNPIFLLRAILDGTLADAVAAAIESVF